MKMKPKFLVIDGIDGSGKSTAMSAITDTLKQHGISYTITREPGGTPLAEQIRDVLLAKRDEPMEPNAELLMMFASRAQNLAQRILPALKEGTWVISDRFTSTTKAYQGAARGMSMKHINALENMVQGSFRPDMTFLLDLDPVVGKLRTSSRGNENRLDQEGLDFMSRAREGFLSQAKSDPERFSIVDASRSIEEVYEDIRTRMEEVVRISRLPSLAVEDVSP